MTTQRTFEPHEFAPYAEANNICRHCNRGRYALHHEQPRPEQGSGTTTGETVPCELCATPTRMKGTKRCDRCWELEHRIQDNPELARKILAATERHDDAPAAPERGERWQQKDNEIFIHREMAASELVDARAKGFKTTDIRYTVARFYGEDAEENAQRAIDAVNQHSTLIAQRERLLRLLRPVTSPTACYCAVMGNEKCWHCKARQLITTIEQEGTR